MNKSESITNLSVAMAKFQSEIKNPSNSAVNPHFKSKYAPLNEILNSVRPLLSKHGLAVMQFPSGNGENIIINTLLTHESGEWIEADPLTLKADKVTAQGAGSAITYGRRYSLSALLGISSEDDDDGNTASNGSGNGSNSNPSPPKTQQTTPQQNTSPTSGSQSNGDKASEAQIKAIYAMLNKKNLVEADVKEKYNIVSMKDLSKKQASELIGQLQSA